MTWYFHVDMDAFYASVEQLDNPELQGLPVVVGGRPGGRGVVSACSYEARKYGIHSAMPTAEAYRRCPEALFLPVRMGRYREVSRSIMRLFGRYTPEVQQISVDEAFLDMSGTERLFGPIRETGENLKETVRRESGLAISVGIAPTRYLAKLASDFDKPDGLYLVAPGDEISFIDQLSLNKLWGVGKQLRRRLESLGYVTPETIREESIHTLRGLFGPSSGTFLYQVSRGEDPGIYSGEALSHSISSERTFETDLTDRAELEHRILALSEEVMMRCFDEEVSGRVVLLKLRDSEFNTISGRRSFSTTLQSSQELFEAARNLFNKKWAEGTPIRLIGVGVGNVAPHNEAQGELFDEETGRRRRRLEQTVHDLRRRFGDIPMGRASNLKPPEDE